MPPAVHDASYTVASSTGHDLHARTRAQLLIKRQGPVDEVLPYPPPAYIPSIPLHASTVTLTDPSDPLGTISSDAPNSPATPGPLAASRTLHGTNIGLLVGAVLASAVLMLVLAGLGWYMIRRRAGKLRAAHPRFSMFYPHAKLSAASAEVDTLRSNLRPQSAAKDGEQFVFISTSDEDLQGAEKRYVQETPPLEVLGRIGSVFATDEGSLRRHSSPAVLEEFARQIIAASISEPIRPLSLPPVGKADLLYVQRQKTKELAQMMRMRITGSNSYQSPSRSSVLSEIRGSIIDGLGIVREMDEVDIVSNASPTLHRDSWTSTPITDLFEVNKDGEIIRLSLLNNLASSPSNKVLASDDDSVQSDDSTTEDLKSAVVLRVGRARSMDFKRPVLISVHTSTSICASPPASHSAPLLTTIRNSGVVPGADTHMSNSASTISSFPSPPPMLSPVFLEPTMFAEDVSQSLQERLFAYQESNLWLKAQYGLATGQI